LDGLTCKPHVGRISGKKGQLWYCWVCLSTTFCIYLYTSYHHF